ncbi:para-nitrobenzyl esterase-like [Oppia nitens]|uniref:para-nitrobenzyl esterase-like n=1 Tax=Oppia nitens TaxID=1686743 RepID=UPI0023DC59EB|nr:para-nitrobenzyl esterase-like [Oppia nitens]
MSTKDKTKIIENYIYEDEERLLDNDKHCDYRSADKQFVWLSLTSSRNSSKLWPKRCLCYQIFIVCVLFIFTMCSLFILLTKLSEESQHSINRFIERFPYLSRDDSNETDSFDKSFINTKLRHGSVRVITHCGTLIGGKENDAFVFKGIPYAEPPIDALRWSPPEPVCNPDSHRHCNKFGSHCFQVNPISRVLEGNEDCLYLNVWTPTIDPEANLSVMVWIHGGFLQFGSGHQPGLKPNGKLAKKTNTIYLSLNYRLHAFGFLGLDLLANNTKESTNFGLMDVILALQWIQLNIRSFGGNHNKVTLFGADSGAALILALMTNPIYRSLYYSVWLIDPAVYFDRSIAMSSKEYRKNFLKRTNCRTVDCLRSLSAQHIIRAFIGKNDPSFRIIDQNDLPILGFFAEQLITIDNSIVLDWYPFNKMPNDIPILMGSSAQTVSFWPGPRELMSWTWADYNKYVTMSMDSFGPRLSQLTLSLYQPSSHRTAAKITDAEPMTPQLQYITMVSDMRQICPINYMSEVLATKSQNPYIYRYIFNARISKPVRVYEYGVNYSFHLMDILSFFGQLEVWIRWPTFNDYSISETIQQIVMAFIQPNNSTELWQSFQWQSFPKQTAEVVSQLNYTSIVTTNYHQTDRCYFWQSEQFFSYMWTV